MDGIGEIAKKELIWLIETLFPVMAHDAQRRPQLQELIRDADIDCSNTVDFQEYLRLMGQLRELQDRDRLVKEQMAVKETGFSKQEVKDFRDLFLRCDVDGDGELTLKECIDLMKSVGPVSSKNVAEFAVIFRDVSNRQHLVEGSADCADFPEFLWFMHALLETNWGNEAKDNVKDTPLAGG